MIITKQMIKTNQVLLVGWSLSIGKIRVKLWMSQQPSLKQYVILPYKVRSNRMNIVREPLLLSVPKKVKEALRTRLSGNKITSTETFVRSKEFAKWKTTLNEGTLACYENLPIKAHLKKRAIFFVCNRKIVCV